MQQYIDSAVEQFKTLLTQQIARQQEMEKNNEVTDYQALDKIVIGICSGDGIGPIISKESERILNYILKDEINAGRLSFALLKVLPLKTALPKIKPFPMMFWLKLRLAT